MNRIHLAPLLALALAAGCTAPATPSNPVHIDAFTATPNPVAAGGDVTLSWSVSGDVAGLELFAGATALGTPAETTGSLVLPKVAAGDVEVTLHALASSGTDQFARIVVHAVEAPEILRFAADRRSVAAGSAVTLTWEAARADEVTISAGSQEIATRGPTGALLVTPAVSTVYTLTAKNVAGTATATVSVSMLPEPTITLLEATPTRVPAGSPVTVHWKTTDATALALSVGGRASYTAPEDSVAEGTRELVPDATGTISARATGPGGEVTRELHVDVDAPVRIVSFGADRSDVELGKPVVLSWAVEGADEVAITANGSGSMLTEPTATTGTLTVTPTETTVYELTATGHGTATAATTVTVFSLPIIDTFQADRTQVYLRRDPAILSWTTHGGTAVSIADGAGDLLDLHGAGADAGSVAVSPTRDTSYTLTLLGSGGVVKSAPIALTVREPAPAVELTLTSTNVLKGETATLVWTVTDHVAMSITAKTGSGPTTTLNLAGHETLPPAGSFVVHDGLTLPPPADTTTYTLTATGPGGTTVKSVTLTVTKVPTFTNLTSDHLVHDAATNTDAIVVTRGSYFSVTWTTQDADRVQFVEPPYSLSNEPFVDIDGLPGTQPLQVNSFIQGATDDGMVLYQQFPEGFTFPFYGRRFAGASMAVDGYVCFGANRAESSCGTTNSIFTNNQGTTDPSNLIAVFWDDLQMTASTKLLMRLENTTPARKLTLEWKDIDFKNLSAQGAHLSFKLEMFEDGRWAIWNAVRERPTINVGDNTRWGTSATIGNEPAFPNPMPWYGLNIQNNDTTASTLCHTFVPGRDVPTTFGQCDPFTRAGTLPLEPPNGSQTVYLRADDSVKLKASSAVGETLSKVLPVKVVDPVTVNTFTASRTVIGLGESVQLAWALGPSANAIVSERLSDGTTDLAGVSGLSGNLSVSPSVTTTYTFYVKNAAGDGDRKSVTVTVGKPVVTFNVDRTVGQPGEAFTFSWTTAGAQSLALIDPNGTTVASWSGSANQATIAAGTLAKNLTVSGTYKLDATNASGTTRATVTLDIPTALRIAAFTASAVEQTAGQNVTLHWEVLNGASVRVQAGGADLPGMPVTGAAQVRANDLPATVGAADTTWTLTATAAGGATQTAQVTVHAVAPAVISTFVATPPDIFWNDSTTLTWSTANAASVHLYTLDGVGPAFPEIAAAAGRTSGSVTVKPLATTSYRLDVTNRLGTLVQQTLTVSVTVPPPTVSLALTPATGVPNGGSLDVAWNSTRADQVVLWQREPAGAPYAADPMQIPYDYVPFGFVDISATGRAITSLVSPFNGLENLDSGYAIVDFPADFRPPFLGEVEGRFLVSAEGVILLAPPPPAPPATDPFVWDICKTAACVTPQAIGPTGATTAPSARLFPFWANLIARNGCATSYLDCSFTPGRPAGHIYWQVLGSAPNRVLVVQFDQWDANQANAMGTFTFEAKLYENGDTEFQYKTLDSINVNFAHGASAVIGVDRRTGPAGTNYFLALGNNTMSVNAGDGWRMYTGVQPASGHVRSFFNTASGNPPTVGFRAVATNAAPVNNRATATAAENVLAGVNELLISELMIDPVDGGDDTGKEWIELRNRRGTPVSLAGYTIQTSSGSYTFNGGLVPAATSQGDGYFVIGQSTDPAVNGGVDVQLAYDPRVTMDDAADTVILRYGTVLVDRVEYDAASGWNVPHGASLALDGGPAFAVAAGGDAPIAWCRGRGTPGAERSPGQANPACNVLQVIPYEPAFNIAGDATASAIPWTWGVAGDRWGTITLPFAYDHFGTKYRQLAVSDNGMVSFGPLALSQSGAYSVNQALPNPGAPLEGLYPYWDDLDPKSAGGALTWKVLGAAPNRVVVVEWDHYNPRAVPTAEMTFFVVLREAGGFEFYYPNLGGQNGSGATIGFEAMGDSFAVQYSFNQAVLPPAGVGGAFGLKYFRVP